MKICVGYKFLRVVVSVQYEFFPALIQEQGETQSLDLVMELQLAEPVGAWGAAVGTEVVGAMVGAHVLMLAEHTPCVKSQVPEAG